MKADKRSMTSITGRIFLATILLGATFIPGSASAEPGDTPMQSTPVGIDGSGHPLEAPAIPTEAEVDETSNHVPANPQEMTPEGIIGDDNRERIEDTTTFPNSAVVYIQFNGRRHCSGWLISRDTVVTAGHCVYNPSTQKWFHGLQISPGANGQERPFGTAQATQLWTDAQWIAKSDPRQDWGILKLDTPIGDQTGWFGMMWRDWSYDGETTNLRGYPADKPEAELWGMEGRVEESHPNQLCYYTDTYRSQSGSPVYSADESLVLAIHTYSNNKNRKPTPSLCPGEYNAGTRITKSLFNVILQLR